jgi:S1-C subfamily serine protease
MNRLQVLLGCCVLMLPLPVCAEIYQWVDENGQVRFSDKPPPGQEMAQEEPAEIAGAATATRRGRIQKAEGATRKAMLEVIRYQIQDSDLDGEIGKRYNARNASSVSSSACGTATTLLDTNFASTVLRTGKVGYQTAFHRLLREYNYSVIDRSSSVFANQRAETPEISIAALIKKAYFEHCSARYNQNRASFNKTKLTIEWQLFDNLSRVVLFTKTTEGKDDKFGMPPVPEGELASFEQALMQAAEILLSDPGFLAAVSTDAAPILNSKSDNVIVKVSYGGNNQRFIDRSASIQEGTVTIRTPAGHGSGFFVSSNGYILTNEHVVSGARQVLVITSTGQEFGEVVVTDPKRDVALVRVQSGFSSSPLQISNSDVRVGQEIYAIGTPLSEDLSFTVTRGIISGKREMSGLSLLQTDAAINPGNSGGPIIDAYGNVIAISVSGIFTQSGASLNTNFLIPIADALSKLGIEGH